MRDQDSIGLEADYWKLVIQDVAAINEAVSALNEQASEVAAVAIMLIDSKPDAAELLLDAVAAQQRDLVSTQERVNNLLDLAKGRASAMEGELG